MAKKAYLVCRPCGTAVTVSDLGAAVIECWECGVELEPGKVVTAKTLIPAKAAAKKKAPPAKAKKPAAKKAAAKGKKK